MVSFADDSAVSAGLTVAGTLKLDLMPIVDIRLLSQSELYSLATCSSSAFDPNRCDDVVIPKIDRSVFNESAGSRKQTYSRLRLAPPLSSPVTLRRRTPHLRPFSNSVSNFNHHGAYPEHVENSRIINLLKKLFCSEMTPIELIPVDIDYSQPILPSKLPPLHDNLPSPSVSSVDHTGQKRKRGRPRKNETLQSGREQGSVVGIIKKKQNDFKVMDEVFVGENKKIRDAEFMNKDGVAVDFTTLGRIEHPYWEEIRRRTEGLQSEDEFLGFLSGFDGQWMSPRKKKRIVDASEFGNALPIGWKLLLSIKRKMGCRWLYCRRYISPSGRLFMSCKDVSAYLISLDSVQVTCSADHEGFVVDSNNLASIDISDHCVIGENKEYPGFNASPPALAAGNHEMQIAVNSEKSPEDKVTKILSCGQCNMSFCEKGELLQHQSSLNCRNQIKDGVHITKVDIKEGKEECQFCQKSCNGRCQPDDHVEDPVRYQARIAGESESSGKKVLGNPSNFGVVLVLDNVTERSLGSKRTEDAEVCHEVTCDGSNYSTPCKKDTMNAIASEKVNMGGVNEDSNAATTTNPSSISEFLASKNEKISLCEASENASATGRDTEITDDLSFQANSGRCPPLQFPDGTLTSGINKMLTSAEKLEQGTVAESRFFNSDSSVETCDPVVKAVHDSQAVPEFNLNSDNFEVSDSVFDFFESHRVQDKETATTVDELSNSGVILKTSTSISVGSRLVKNPKRCFVAPYDGKSCVQSSYTCSIGSYEVDETFCFEAHEKDHSIEHDNALSRHEELDSGICSVIPDKEMSTCEMMGQCTSRNVSIALSSHQNYIGAENNDDKNGRGNVEAPEFYNSKDSGNGELMPFGSSCASLNSVSVGGKERNRKDEIFSNFTSAMGSQLFLEDHTMGGLNNAFEGQKQGFDGFLLGPGSLEVSNVTYGVNNLRASSGNQFKPYISKSGKNDTSLSFDNLNEEMLIDSFNLVRSPESSFGIQSSVPNKCSLQVHSSTRNSYVCNDLKQGEPLDFDFLDSSFQDRAHNLGSVGKNHPGREWNQPRGEMIETSGQVFSFENNKIHLDEIGSLCGSWRTGGNVFPGDFAVSSTAKLQPSRRFRPSDLMSNKDEDSSFGVNERMNDQTDVQRQCRTQPVEYSFMAELSSNSITENSKIFQYTDIEQGLDPLYTHKHVTSVCAWCGNFFHHDSLQTGQQGAINSLCPSCDSRFPGQFNVL